MAGEADFGPLAPPARPEGVLTAVLPAGLPPAKHTRSLIGLGSSRSGSVARDTDELLAEGFGRN